MANQSPTKIPDPGAPTPPPPYVRTDASQQERIVMALERIADSLETMTTGDGFNWGLDSIVYAIREGKRE